MEHKKQDSNGWQLFQGRNLNAHYLKKKFLKLQQKQMKIFLIVRGLPGETRK